MILSVILSRQVQSLQSDILRWERRHQEDKLDVENAIKLAKEDMAAVEAAVRKSYDIYPVYSVMRSFIIFRIIPASTS